MTCVLQHNSYGKSQVRLTKVSRNGSLHDIQEMTVSIELEGAFEQSYYAGDNSSLVATDSMKNTVYVLAAENQVDSPEAFGVCLAKHFLATYSQIAVASVCLVQSLWQRLDVDGQPHEHAFVGGQSEKRCAKVSISRSATCVQSGIEGLAVLKTTNSGFVGFVRDRFTTLAEVTDRIFATNIDCWWTCDQPDANFNDNYRNIRSELLRTFGEHNSLGVQQTLQAMGENILKLCPQVNEVDISMPNQHRIPFDLRPFQLENRNEIFVTTSEPYGVIKGTVTRSTVQTNDLKLTAGVCES